MDDGALRGLPRGDRLRAAHHLAESPHAGSEERPFRAAFERLSSAAEGRVQAHTQSEMGPAFSEASNTKRE
jgi:hypothetical protein